MSNLDVDRVSFNAKALEEAIKLEILVKEILPYPKDLLNFYIRKIHF